MARTKDVRGPQSPQEFLTGHPLTLKLKKLGVTNEQLESPGELNLGPRGYFVRGWPEAAQPLCRPYGLLRWLVLEDPPHSDRTRAAWESITDALAADYVLAQKNAAAASAPRPKRTAESALIRTLLEKDRNLSEKEIRRALDSAQVDYKSKGLKDRISRHRKNLSR